MDKLMDIAQKYNLIVIEDSAQSLGTTYKGKKAGSFGLASCFSFYPAKLLGAFGDAGAVATNDPVIAEKIRLLRNMLRHIIHHILEVFSSPKVPE